MYYYNYNVLCNDYLKGGIIQCDEEMYAESYESLVNQVREAFNDTYDVELTEAEPIRVEINYSDDPKYMKGEN